MKSEIIVIGAGSAGLMAARELSKAGKKVLILEARDRIGGRIMPLSEDAFGYPAQGGAEFVHGEASLTKALIQEAGLTFVAESEDAEVWSMRDGSFALQKSFMQGNEMLKEKLERLEKDVSIAEFLEANFGGEEHFALRNSILKMVEGYEAADPRRVSTFMLRSGWFGKKYHGDGWIKEGYGALLDFLKTECDQNGAKIVLNTSVASIDYGSEKIIVLTDSGKSYEAEQILITVPLPVLKNIKFVPDISEKVALAEKIGFGPAIKLLIRFKDQWWKHAAEKDLSRLSFALCNDDFTAWWTQFPIETNVLVGWMAGPNAEKNKNLSDDELLNLGLLALSHMFSVTTEFLKTRIESFKAINWSNDPFALGAYSYTAMDAGDSAKKLVEPINNKIFFGGEALYSGEATSTVEGALASGLETANKVLNK